MPGCGVPSEIGHTALFWEEVTMHSGKADTRSPLGPQAGKADGVIAAFLADARPPEVPPLVHPQETTVSPGWETIIRDQVGPETPGESFMHSGWSLTRRKVIASMFRTRQSESRIKAFMSCGRNAWIEAANDDPTRLRMRCTCCHDRLCQPCAATRAFRIRDAMMGMIHGKRCRFITLTLCGKKSDKLTDLVDRLYKSFRALRLHPTWANAVDGGAAFLEIKRSSKADRWHPHFHIIAEGRFLPQADLSDAWRSITKDSYVVDVRDARDEAVSHYVAKYASKPLNSSFANNPSHLDEAMEALKGRRLCTCFGSWYGTPLSEAEENELADDLVDAHGYHFVAQVDDVIAAAACGDHLSMTLLRDCPGAMERFVRFTNSGP
jgi:hypothetical protein